MEWAANRMESSEGFPLLTTKLQAARPQLNIVQRDRLIERLDEGQQGRLVLVTAPAGFGKTTLLSIWATLDGRNVAWLSLDAGDSLPARFWAYVLGAIQRVQPGVGTATGAAIRSGESIEYALTPLLNELAGMAGTLTLILDDYHTITDPDVHASLNFFIERMPPQVHVFISSRTAVPLQLARLRARGELLEVRESDLRLTAAESAELLERVAGREMSRDEREEITRQAEGWVVGLQLTALSRRAANPIAHAPASFTLRYPYLAEFVFGELTDRVPDARRSALLQTAALGSFNGQLAAAVTGATGTEDWLRTLAGAEFFIVPLDDRPGWYRFNRLVGTLFRERLETAQPDIVHIIHERAAEWLEAHGMMREAVGHLAAAGDSAGAARLAERCAERLLADRDMATLLEWSRCLAEEQIVQRPKLALAFAWASLLSGQSEAAASFMAVARRAAPHPPIDGLADIQGHIAALESALGAATPPINESVPTGTERLPHLHKRERQHQHVQTAHPRTRFSLAEALPEMGMLQIRQGKLNAAAATFQEAIEMLDSRVSADEEYAATAAFCYIGRGAIEFEWNNLDAAMRMVREGLEHGRMVARTDIVRDGFLLLAQIHQARGDLAGALDAIAEAEEELEGMGADPQDRVLLDAGRARISLAKGLVDDAALWSRHSQIESLQAGSDELDEELGFTLVRIQLALHRTEEALQVLAPIVRDAEEKEHTGILLTALLLRALAYDRAGETEQAAQWAQRALALGEPERYVRTFLREGPAAIRLLKKVRALQESGELARAITSDYIRTLLIALGEPVSAAGSTAAGDTGGEGIALLTPISDREIEVLRLIADGKSNASIADSLYISVSTVKTHINNLYSKLGVESRTQALARAREYNLI